MTSGADGIYVAWPVFDDYATKGSLICRLMIRHALSLLLGERRTLDTSLEAQGIVTLTRREAEGRHVLHLLHGSPVRRGADVEVIEDLPVVQDVTVSLRGTVFGGRVTLQPQGLALEFAQHGDTTTFAIPRLECHQMVELAAPTKALL